MEKITLSNKCYNSWGRIKFVTLLSITILLFMWLGSISTYATMESSNKPEAKVQLKSEHNDYDHVNNYTEENQSKGNNYDNRTINTYSQTHSNSYKSQEVRQDNDVKNKVNATIMKELNNISSLSNILGNKIKIFKTKINNSIDLVMLLSKNNGTKIPQNQDSTSNNLNEIWHETCIFAKLSSRQLTVDGNRFKNIGNMAYNGIIRLRNNEDAVFCAVQKQFRWIVAKRTLF